MLNLTIYGQPRSKKNSMQAICKNGKPRLIQSALYLKYEREALRQLLRWGNYQFDSPVRVVCKYWVQDRRKRDLINLLAATHDILEKAAIIKDDSLIKRVDGSEIVGVDKLNPRVEVRIEVMGPCGGSAGTESTDVRLI